ncbi:MAG TPA: TonB-dependent receptor [Bacteroides sp.]|nr:TonB-dependent receptor [Bacteroides sp.]
MPGRIFHIAAFIACIQVVSGQGIQDSVFRIGQVDVTAESFFRKETAGMKETGVDSTVLAEKINLSLSELLSENTPVFIKNHGRGALATASFRGTAASHTRVNWNGIHINTPMAGMVDFSLIPVYLVDEVQLKHGTASIADGSGGLGGSVNISNRADWNRKLGGKYMQGIGSYNTFDEFFQFSAGNRRIRSSTRLYHSFSANDYPFINRGIGHLDPLTGKVFNPLDTNKNAAYERSGILQELYFRPDHRQIISLKYWGQWAGRSVPQATSYEGPDFSNLNHQQDTDHKVVADWKYVAGRSTIGFRSGYTDRNIRYVLRNYIPGLGQIPAIYSVSTQRSFLNRLSFTFEPGPDFSIEGNLDANLYDVFTQDTVRGTGYTGQQKEQSLLLALGKRFGDRVNLNLMVRQDRVDGAFLPPVPYLGFDFRVIEGKELLLKGNVARNYHRPSLNDLYWQPGGNPDLLPEQGMSYELGVEYLAGAGHFKFHPELTVYRSDINDWIIWIPSYRGYWEPENIRKVVSQGAELSARLSGKTGRLYFTAGGTYAFTSSVNYGDPLVWGDESYGKQLVYVPLHSGNVMVNLSYRGFFITYQHNSYSERFTTSSNDITRRDWLYPYFMNDFTAGKEFRIGKVLLSAEMKIYNLLNETYHSILYRPMPGRNYLLQIMVKY